jgi:cysteine desulfurase
LLESGLLARLPGARIHGASAHRAPGIVNVCLGGVDGEAVLHELDHAGIVVSTGSACSAASPGPSHVILALGLGPEDAHGSVRFSLGASNDEAQVERVLDVVPEVVAKLRALAGTQAEHGRAAS